MNADFAHQAAAAGRGAFGSFHGHIPVIDLHRHMGRDTAKGKIVDFRPIEGDPVKSATGAALKTRIETDTHLIVRRDKSDWSGSSL